MPRLAIIIPAVGGIQSLETTLVSVLEHRPKDCEVIVALNTAYDDPYRLEGEVRFIDALDDSSFAACAKRGILESRAGLVHLVSPGCEVTEGWADAALRHFGNPRVAAVAPLVLDADERDRVLAAGVGYSAGGRRSVAVPALAEVADSVASSGLGPCGFAAFYRKSALERVSGALRPHVGDALHDVDLALLLRQLGFLAMFEPQSRIFAQTEPTLREGAFQCGLHAERLFWRHAPHKGWLKSLLTHPWTVVAETIGYLPHPSALAHLAGRLIACCQIGSYRHHHQQMAQLKDQLAILPLPRRASTSAQSGQGNTDRRVRSKAG